MPTFLGIDTAEAIAQNHPVYEATDIPAGAFGGAPDRPDDEIKTISFNHHIVARKAGCEVDRVAPRHIGVLHTLQDAHRAPGLDHRAEQEV